MHAANGACKICRVHLWNPKSGEFELQIVLTHLKFSPFWDKTNVHHNTQLGQVVNENKQTSPTLFVGETQFWSEEILRRTTFRVHHSLLPCLKVEPMSEHQQKRIHHISISDCLYSWQTQFGKPVDMVCLCKYPWISHEHPMDFVCFLLWGQKNGRSLGLPSAVYFKWYGLGPRVGEKTPYPRCNRHHQDYYIFWGDHPKKPSFSWCWWVGGKSNW